MRHGHADAIARRDADRELTSRGKKAVDRVSRALASLGLRPSKILASPLVRAQQTATIAARALASDTKIDTEKLLVPEGNVDHLVTSLPSDEECLLLVSHMPLVGDLLGRLLCGSAHSSMPLSTSCAVWLEVLHPGARDGRLRGALSAKAARRMLGED